MQRTKEALDLLVRLIKNVTENPNDEKFRHFKKVKNYKYVN